jgi:hypothetical protein
VCSSDLEFDEFITALDENNIDLEAFAASTEEADLETNSSCTKEQAQAVTEVFGKLAEAFNKATGGLELGLQFHEADDRGDEVDGVFWTVEGVYVLSTAGKIHQDKIQRKSWTVYG